GVTDPLARSRGRDYARVRSWTARGLRRRLAVHDHDRPRQRARWPLRIRRRLMHRSALARDGRDGAAPELVRRRLGALGWDRLVDEREPARDGDRLFA